LNITIQELEISGVLFALLPTHTDQRGWLCETFRPDWFARLPLTVPQPAMSYISATLPGQTRGPHEHRNQTDIFVFFGSTIFLVYLWDNRPASKTYKKHLRLSIGEEKPGLVIVPAGVVHAYKNIGTCPGFVLNQPDRLYRSWNKNEPPDEIRYEDDPASPFKTD